MSKMDNSTRSRHIGRQSKELPRSHLRTANNTLDNESRVGRGKSHDFTAEIQTKQTDRPASSSDYPRVLLGCASADALINVFVNEQYGLRRSDSRDTDFSFQASLQRLMKG